MSKKAAKIASDAKIKENLPGTHVLYMGLGGKRYCCPTCNRAFSRGFYYRENNETGCSRKCLKKQIS